MVGRRHASGEITAKLAQAHELAAKGKTQREISKALGVSIMTYHRWKKQTGSGDALDRQNTPRDTNVFPVPREANAMETIQRLELENSQLRRLVTDMLLDKMKLETEVRARQDAQLRRPRKR